MKLKTFFLVIALLSAVAARAEPAGDDPIAKVVFPPELVMKYSQEINLDEHQRTTIKENVQKAQAKFVDVQFELQTEGQKLARLLQAKPADEAAVLTQVDKVLALEREVKRTQIALVVRIKNLLTDAQQAKLTELRRQE